MDFVGNGAVRNGAVCRLDTLSVRVRDYRQAQAWYET